MIRAVAVALALTLGCSEPSAPSARTSDPATADAAPAAVEVALAASDAAPEPPPFGPEIRSLELVRSIAVKFEPTVGSKNLGTVAAHTRVGWRQTMRAAGCAARWIEIEPRGWLCEANVKPSRLPPSGVELPRLGFDEVVPGEYGKVTGKGGRTVKIEDGQVVAARELDGASTVRRYSELEVAGKLYWSIGGGEYLLASSIARHAPTWWSGVRLGDETGRSLPLGFAIAAKGPLGPVPVHPDPTGGSERRKLERRTPFSILEVARGADGAEVAYRIGDGEWIRAADARIARVTDPPPHTLPDERWFDVDLDTQILVAYEGTAPVYATMVTTGKNKTPTETGIFRIWIKFAETDMNGQMGDEAPYSVATVPWTQFYAKDLALHTAYWHDKFGTRRSHGCINLAPVDARFLYFWSSPDVPPGWSMAHGVAERPGSMVRIRSAADPDPEFKGYARHVDDLRSGRVSRAAGSLAP